MSLFQLTAEDGDLLVPEGILSGKFTTHLDQPGVSQNTSTSACSVQNVLITRRRGF